MIDTNIIDTIDSAAEAEWHFSRVTRTMEHSSPARKLTDDERIDIAAAHVLEKYKPAFKELAK